MSTVMVLHAERAKKQGTCTVEDWSCKDLLFVTDIVGQQMAQIVNPVAFCRIRSQLDIIKRGKARGASFFNVDWNCFLYLIRG